MPTLTEWLESQGVGRYATLFAQHEIGLDVLPDLTEHDLEKLGLPLGARKRLFRKRGASPFIALLRRGRSWLPDLRGPRAADCGVMRGKRHRVCAGGCDYEPVGRIAVKRCRQCVEGEYHLDTERQYADHAVIGGAGEPLGKRQRQLEPSFGVQHLDFPETDCREEQFTAFRLCIERITLGTG